MTFVCGWCKQEKPSLGWHDCKQAVRGRRQLNNALTKIHETLIGGPEPVMGRTEMEEYWNQKDRDKTLEVHRVSKYIREGGK